MLAEFLHWQHGETIGPSWMLGLGFPGCPFLYNEHLWKELCIQKAFSVRFSLRPIQRLHWTVSIKSWPCLHSATLAWCIYSPLLHCLEILGSVEGSQPARSVLPCLLCLAGLETSVSQAQLVPEHNCSGEHHRVLHTAAWRKKPLVSAEETTQSSSEYRH